MTKVVNVETRECLQIINRLFVFLFKKNKSEKCFYDVGRNSSNFGALLVNVPV